MGKSDKKFMEEINKQRELLNKLENLFRTGKIVADNLPVDNNGRVSLRKILPKKVKVKLKPGAMGVSLKNSYFVILEEEGLKEISGKQIKTTIEKIISGAENEIFALITRDFTHGQDWLFDLLLSKAQEHVKISIILRSKEENSNKVRNLRNRGVEVRNWTLTEEIPLGIYYADSEDILVTVIGQWKTLYKHNVGILVRNKPTLQKGLAFLLQWFIVLCEKIQD